MLFFDTMRLMIASAQKLPKTILSFSIIALLLMGTLGLPHFGMNMENMDMEGNMTMTDCYMPGMATICNMSPLEHIASWQGMFTSLPTQSSAITLLLLLLSTVIGFVWTRQIHSPPLELRTFSQFLRQREYVPLHSPLQELYSNGILNPKVF